MAYPAGLTTRAVSFGQAVVLESGTALAMKVTIKASRTLVHRPTGSPLVSVTTLFQSSDEGSRTLSLPVTDSDEMGLGNGQSIVLAPGEVTHFYTATVEYLEPGTLKALPGGPASRTVGPFVLPSTGPEVVDLDDLQTSMEPVSGNPSNIPIFASEKGQPSGVAALDADGDVLDAAGEKITASPAPDLTGYATTNYVDEAVEGIEFPAAPVLSRVAASGSYGDLTSRPGVGYRAIYAVRLTGTFGIAVAYYEAGRRLIRVQNTGTADIQLKYTSGAVQSQANFGTPDATLTPGQEFVDSFNPNALWMRNSTGAAITVLVIKEGAY